MKNFEKFEKEIMAISSLDYCLAVVNGVPQKCVDTICGDCDFKCGVCSIERIKWLYRECVEKPKLTKKERQFVELMGNNMHLTRDMDDILYLNTDKPYKTDTVWKGNGYTRMDNFNNLNFDFIKWEDEEPWSVEELLKLEVEE